MVEKIRVTIISENKDGKQVENVVETVDLLRAVRVMLSFKPKRGYKMIRTNVEGVEVLV